MRIYEASIAYRLIRLGEETALDSPEAVFEYMEDAFDEDPTVEWFFAILLDRQNFPIGRKVVSRGTASSTMVHPRETFKGAILAGASGVIVVHNHPSGNPQPSRADIQVTRSLKDAARILDIVLQDHVIMGDKQGDPTGLGYYSFREAGLL